MKNRFEVVPARRVLVGDTVLALGARPLQHQRSRSDRAALYASVFTTSRVNDFSVTALTISRAKFVGLVFEKATNWYRADDDVVLVKDAP